MAKAKKKKKSKAPVKKSKAKTAIKKSGKKSPVKKKGPTKKASSVKKTKAKKSVKAVAKTPAPKKAAVKKTKQIVGEGDYQASKTFLKDQSDFVKRNKSKIPALAAEAEKALDGPEGDELRAADKEAASHSKAGHEE